MESENVEDNFISDDIKAQRSMKTAFLAILILVVALGFLAYFVVWNILLNKGDITFEGTAPFTIVSSTETIECAEKCMITIPSGLASFELQQEDRISKTVIVDVRRGEMHNIIVDLSYQFVLSESQDYLTYKLPTGYSKVKKSLLDISLFNNIQEEIELKKMPKLIDNLVFSENGKKALIYSDDKIFVYDTTEFTLTEIEADIGYKPIFGGGDDFVYAIINDEELERSVLVKYNFVTNEYENLIFFTRPITEYEISLSHNGPYRLLLLDKSQNKQIIYDIDLVKENRNNIFEGYVVELGRWNNDDKHVVFSGRSAVDIDPVWLGGDPDGENVDPSEANLWIYNTETGEIKRNFFATSGPFIVDVNVVDFRTDKTFIYVIQTFDSDINDIAYYLNETNLETGETTLLLNLTNIIKAFPEKGESSYNRGQFKLLSDGEIFEARIGE